MSNEIDYEFISAREGGSKTAGYVPAAGVSNSGVTIATGFDLGCRNVADLNKLSLPATLVQKLTPYLGKTARAASDLVTQRPLTITEEEAEGIDRAVKASAVAMLKARYLASAHNSKKVDFFDLGAEAQTVIASVSFQYGDLETKAPKFWKAVASQDWAAAVEILRNFGDAYSTRRKLEADLLDEIAP